MSKFLQREDVFREIRKILEPPKGNGRRRLQQRPGMIQDLLKGTKSPTGEGK